MTEESRQQPREVPPPKDPGDLYVLGGMYYQGITVPVDKEKAAVLYRMSADRGNEDAMVRLGIILMTGDGTEQDYLEASVYFRMAADRGNRDGKYFLAHLYTLGKGVDRNPVEAVRLCMESAADGCTGAMTELARWYRDGTNYVDKSLAKCIYWLKKACDEKYPEALYELGAMYAFGEGVTKDAENGRILLEYASAAGDRDAEECLEALKEGKTQRP